VGVDGKDGKLYLSVDFAGTLLVLAVLPPFSRIPNPAEAVRLRRCDGWVQIGHNWYSCAGKEEIVESNEDPGVDAEAYQQMLLEREGQLKLFPEGG